MDTNVNVNPVLEPMQDKNGNYVDKSVKNNTYYKYDNTNVYDFFFMHRSKRVALVRMSITHEGVRILRVKIIDKRNLPLALMGLETPTRKIDVGEATEQYKTMVAAFNVWFRERCIPVDRDGIDVVLKSLFGFTGALEGLYNSERKQALLEIAAILAYGRSMTDKYWFNPVRGNKKLKTVEGLYEILCFGDKEHTNLLSSLGVNVAAKDVGLRRHTDYSGMDFSKNGIAQSYGKIIVNDSIVDTNHVQFNTPDFCTNGKVRKRWIRTEDKYYLEKYYNDMGSLKNALVYADTAYKKYPEYFAQPYGINGHLGYCTECFINGYNELVSLRDICLYKNPERVINKEILVKNLISLGLKEENIHKFLNSLLDITNNFDIFTNAGLLMSSETKEVLKFVAWI